MNPTLQKMLMSKEDHEQQRLRESLMVRVDLILSLFELEQLLRFRTGEYAQLLNSDEMTGFLRQRLPADTVLYCAARHEIVMLDTVTFLLRAGYYETHEDALRASAVFYLADDSRAIDPVHVGVQLVPEEVKVLLDQYESCRQERNEGAAQHQAAYEQPRADTSH